MHATTYTRMFSISSTSKTHIHWHSQNNNIAEHLNCANCRLLRCGKYFSNTHCHLPIKMRFCKWAFSFAENSYHHFEMSIESMLSSFFISSTQSFFQSLVFLLFTIFFCSTLFTHIPVFISHFVIVNVFQFNFIQLKNGILLKWHTNYRLLFVSWWQTQNMKKIYILIENDLIGKCVSHRFINWVDGLWVENGDVDKET